MNGKDLVVLGKFGAVYGINGWLKVNSYTDIPEGIFDYTPWQIQVQGNWRQMQISGKKRHGNGLIVKLADVADRDQAQLYVNADIAVERSALPQLAEGDFYWRDLMGMAVVNEAGYHLGEVVDMMETGSNDVLVVKANKSDAFGKTERLLPFLTDSVIKEVNNAERRILVDWDPDF
ncbi:MULTISPECIES: ribosome maturation factor RimM [Rheinheimera]|uniref:Ribosome maturation factor RimM n=1 Tax=Rheinheimera tangshanensis TaxID=400153 RepID=A0A5C8M072_9GAMM|nr:MULTISPECIES: ribosome maturation factor RimM [Rheinheimera]MBU1619459.1 ribosome maturation factor RimM [Gammaproteobacteria bacterium]OGO74594.1 MAG: ribosome maturation factor RimM [Chromatiales bacterium RIFOXYA1_FULL_46_5]KOO59525.1 16S rRNA-processing protein RimM [Rheinheimera sp. KL1]MBU2059760.1 ribosome maturation factor RimM [Gammaproteobacteria bacterium]MBU2175460.1 ribosome maturation factor RimM [Gammaproteobacteria bacterium]